VSEFLQSLGLAALVVAAWSFSMTAGLVALGLALILAGYAVEGVRPGDVVAAVRVRLPKRKARS
jgi:hypothetical protein